MILERVDAAGRPVAPDEPAARTLATGLTGRTFPFIRYDLGNEVTLLPGRCACGSSMLRVADIAGRHDDDFRYGERMIPASAFRSVLGTDPLISEYQVPQTADGADVLVVGSPDVSAVAAAGLIVVAVWALESSARCIERSPRASRRRFQLALRTGSSPACKICPPSSVLTASPAQHSASTGYGRRKVISRG